MQVKNFMKSSFQLEQWILAAVSEGPYVSQNYCHDGINGRGREGGTSGFEILLALIWR